ncbi:hypothetical protein UK12_33925, partial [Saccharothrix sp. ST-888]
VEGGGGRWLRRGKLSARGGVGLRWTADRVEEDRQREREEQGSGRSGQAGERIVVGRTGGPEGGTLLRPAARIDARAWGGEVRGVHISRSDGLAGSDSPHGLIEHRARVDSLGGRFRT